MSASIRNGVRRKVLCLCNGSFSERFAKIAAACGKEVVKAEVPMGQAFEAEQVKALLANSGADSVTAAHSETSTGVLNPIAEIAWTPPGAKQPAVMGAEAFAGVAKYRVDAQQSAGADDPHLLAEHPAAKPAKILPLAPLRVERLDDAQPGNRLVQDTDKRALVLLCGAAGRAGFAAEHEHGRDADRKQYQRQ